MFLLWQLKCIFIINSSAPFKINKLKGNYENPKSPEIQLYKS